MKVSMLNGALRTPNDHQARLVALGTRMLCDEMCG
jgi:hypothetical protein